MCAIYAVIPPTPPPVNPMVLSTTPVSGAQYAYAAAAAGMVNLFLSDLLLNVKQVLNIIKRDISQQDFKSVYLHFVKSE